MCELEEYLRICMLYEFKLGRTACGAYRNLIRAYGEGSVARSTVLRWFAKFRRGIQSLENGTHTGLSKVLDDDELEDTIRENPNITQAELSKMFGVGAATISKHLKRIKTGAKMKFIGHKMREEPIEAARLIAESRQPNYYPYTEPPPPLTELRSLKEQPEDRPEETVKKADAARPVLVAVKTDVGAAIIGGLESLESGDAAKVFISDEEQEDEEVDVLEESELLRSLREQAEDRPKQTVRKSDLTRPVLVAVKTDSSQDFFWDCLETLGAAVIGDLESLECENASKPLHASTASSSSSSLEIELRAFISDEEEEDEAVDVSKEDSVFDDLDDLESFVSGNVVKVSVCDEQKESKTVDN